MHINHLLNSVHFNLFVVVRYKDWTIPFTLHKSGLRVAVMRCLVSFQLFPPQEEGAEEVRDSQYGVQFWRCHEQHSGK